MNHSRTRTLALIEFWSLWMITLTAECNPNIVFIFCVDLGRRDLRNESTTFHESPMIDPIGREGTTFTCIVGFALMAATSNGTIS